MSLNGANRLGSNSLTELLVFGSRAARAAAAFVQQQPGFATDKLAAQADAEQQRIAEQYIRKQGGNERIATIRHEMNLAMEAGAGIYRTEETLNKGCAALAALKERFRNVQLDDRSVSFNTELITAIELEFMLDIAESVMHSALNRNESRGSHQRTDFVPRDDSNYLKHSLAYRTGGAPRIAYKDVVITRWPPGERIYGK